MISASARQRVRPALLAVSAAALVAACSDDAFPLPFPSFDSSDGPEQEAVDASPESPSRDGAVDATPAEDAALDSSGEPDGEAEADASDETDASVAIDASAGLDGGGLDTDGASDGGGLDTDGASDGGALDTDGASDGGALDTDGAPDGGASDGGSVAPRPAVVSSDPPEGATGVYPVEIYDRGPGLGSGTRKRLSLTFDAPMDTSVRTVPLRSGSISTQASATWSADGRTLVVDVLPPDEDSPALQDDTAYALDLRELRDASGTWLDASSYLGDGHLDFRTGESDEMLNHTCQHTLFGPYGSATATEAPTNAPNTNSVHRLYTVTLPPAAAGFAGFTRFRATGSSAAVYTFFFARPIALSGFDEVRNSAATVVGSGPTPPACPGVTHFVKLRIQRGNTHRLFFGPSDTNTTTFVIEPP